jgi:hypothetical protein
LKTNIGYKRWLLRMAAPLINLIIARRSPYRARK